jgi:hypothetical protein
VVQNVVRELAPREFALERVVTSRGVPHLSRAQFAEMQMRRQTRCAFHRRDVTGACVIIEA